MAPFVETFIFFTLPFNIIGHIKTRWKYLSVPKWFVLISSLLFAFNHCFNITYFLSSLLGGVIWSVFFLVSNKRMNNSDLNTTILHSFYNAVVMLLNYI